MDVTILINTCRIGGESEPNGRTGEAIEMTGRRATTADAVSLHEGFEEGLGEFESVRVPDEPREAALTLVEEPARAGERAVRLADGDWAVGLLVVENGPGDNRLLYDEAGNLELSAERIVSRSAGENGVVVNGLDGAVETLTATGSDDCDVTVLNTDSFEVETLTADRVCGEALDRGDVAPPEV
jgi:hypothetical protein